MNKKITALLLTSFLTLAGIGSAFAHAEFESESAVANMHNTFVLGIPHGCEVANTTKVKIAIPSTLKEVMVMGVRQGKNSVKGWKIATEKSGGKLIVVASGPAVASTEEKQLSISFMATTPKKVGSYLEFPTTQYCGSKVNRWVQPHPKDGSDPAEDAFPMPRVKLTLKSNTPAKGM